MLPLFGQEVRFLLLIQLPIKAEEAILITNFFFQEQRCLDGSLDHGCQSQASMILNLAGQMVYELLLCV